MSRPSRGRTSWRNLPSFSHTPSRLSQSTSANDLRKRHAPSDDDEHASDDDQVHNGLPESSSSTPPVPSVPEQFRTPRPKRTSSFESPAPPRTPEIHYSPFATSTPPSGLSKSTSVPFDMVANDKAARQLEVELRQKKEITPTPRRKRFIRRKPFMQRVAAYPQKIIDTWLLNWPPSLESIFPSPRYANPISLGIHVLHWLVLAPLWSSSSSRDSILRGDVPSNEVEDRWAKYDTSDGGGSTVGWKSLLLSVLLIAMASANSVYLFTSFRLYDMQLRSGRETALSPHASPVTAPKVSRRDSTDSEEAPAPSRTYTTLVMTLRGVSLLSKWTYYGILSIFGHHHSDLNTESGYGSLGGDTIQRLKVWEPPEFSLHFFCAYPPSAPLLSHLLTPTHPFLTPILHLITSFLLIQLARAYTQLVKDRMVLSAEVMREYDQRFVYKKVFASKVDRSVGTHDGPWYERHG